MKLIKIRKFRSTWSSSLYIIKTSLKTIYYSMEYVFVWVPVSIYEYLAENLAQLLTLQGIQHLETQTGEQAFSHGTDTGKGNMAVNGNTWGDLISVIYQHKIHIADVARHAADSVDFEVVTFFDLFCIL